MIDKRGKLRLLKCRHLHSLLAARCRFALFAGSSILCNLLHRPPRFDACKRAAGQGVRRARMIVLDFAEQPVLILFAGLSFHSDEQPFALHPFPMQNEMEMSFLKVFCALALDRLPADRKSTRLNSSHYCASLIPS